MRKPAKPWPQLAVLAVRPVGLVDVPSTAIPGFTSKRASARKILYLSISDPFPDVVGVLDGVAEVLDEDGTADRDPEVTRGVEAVQVLGRLLDVAQAPEALQPVEGEAGLDTEGHLLLADERPLQVGVLDVRR